MPGIARAPGAGGDKTDKSEEDGKRGQNEANLFCVGAEEHARVSEAKPRQREETEMGR